ncbi:alpha-N-acetylglucosaminidase [Paraglaciecola arctica BSs20135]|uniref:Alpha-N-acetylglucosaminidase n=2 Tax=Paraglaciecola TaxID=1621534 RepID=K6YEC2_9ALTE|nr:alpha-N-acetylglucosaminidase [Paraglaciecola arctica BSs20135]
MVSIIDFYKMNFFLKMLNRPKVALFLLFISLQFQAVAGDIEAAKSVLSRTLGDDISERFVLKLTKTVDQQANDQFNVSTSDNCVFIEGNSPVALTRASYSYLKQEHNNLLSWSGENFHLPTTLSPFNKSESTPYQYRYYFNVVTHGYSTPYWDWSRWEKEIDWMAMHGMNMPLIGGAHEAILHRVFRKLGFSKQQSYQYFSGPAHFAWNRMGNLITWDGGDKLPESYFDEQIALNHKILKRLRSLGMTPIVHAFAGFVPPATSELFPEAQIRRLSWGGGLPESTYGYLLSPENPLFVKIGKMYIEEWQKEFGKNEYYLADSFNEMDVPPADTEAELLTELAGYGDRVYQSIKAANPDATWVMQGWTFPYHKDENRQLFWTPERLHALVSKVPDDKLLILDLANEYNKLWWKIDPSWKMYSGFFNKKWIYSFIPNMGGKTPLNGRFDIYAELPIDALNYKDKGNLIGFGFAPEGIENNEMIYELLTDMAWQRKAIDVDQWQAKYAMQRYGAYPGSLEKAFSYLNKSALGSFVDHPIHRFQLRPYRNPEGVEDHATVHESEDFIKATGLFLQASEQLKDNKLYQHDAMEITTLFLSLVTDNLLTKFLAKDVEQRDYSVLDEAISVMHTMDKLLAEHPNHQLVTWVDYARTWGSTTAEKDYYESNAKRLLTTWGGDPVNDYAGRVWSGLIGNYYAPRWQSYHDAVKNNQTFDVRQWEENWVMTPYKNTSTAYQDPVRVAQAMYFKYKNYLVSK